MTRAAQLDLIDTTPLGLSGALPVAPGAPEPEPEPTGTIGPCCGCGKPMVQWHARDIFCSPACKAKLVRGMEHWQKRINRTTLPEGEQDLF